MGFGLRFTSVKSACALPMCEWALRGSSQTIYLLMRGRLIGIESKVTKRGAYKLHCFTFFCPVTCWGGSKKIRAPCRWDVCF